MDGKGLYSFPRGKIFQYHFDMEIHDNLGKSVIFDLGIQT